MGLASFDQRCMNGVTFSHRAEKLKTGLTRHAMTQRADLLAGNLHPAHVEELQVRRGLASRCFNHLSGVRPLNLVAIVDATERIGTGSRTLVISQLHVILADFGIVHDPVQRRRTTDQIKALIIEIEQNDVADDIAIGRARHELLRLAGDEALEAVDAETIEQRERAGAFDKQFRHVK